MPYELVPNTGSAPQNAVAYGYQHDSGTVYVAVANTEWGTIPGKAQGHTCWYPYGGDEKYTDDFSWLVAPHYALALRSNDGNGAPPGALGIGEQTDGAGRQYAVIAHTEHGKIPGKADQAGNCWFAYGGDEHQCDAFDWVVETNF